MEDLHDGNVAFVPFVQSSGPNAANLGPVLKHSFSTGRAAPSPSAQTLRTTVKAFREIANSGAPWSGYFAQICDVLARPRLKGLESQELELDPRDSSAAFVQAIRLIPEPKMTVYLTVKDLSGRYPGQVPEYADYLASSIADRIYQTNQARRSDYPAPCPLCMREAILYPNALKGAGLNLGNTDRLGAFPRLKAGAACRAFGLCENSAGMLFVFKNHVMADLLTEVAGAKALVLPEVTGGPGWSSC